MTPTQTIISKTRRKQMKVTTGAKITLTALSLLSFMGGWDLLARLDPRHQVQASAPAPIPQRLIRPTPTPWPTVRPLAQRPLIPTLEPILITPPTASLSGSEQGNGPVLTNDNPILAPIPTLAPLPPLPAPPPPAPSGGGNNHSGGS
jgi:hypothetical protein